MSLQKIRQQLNWFSKVDNNAVFTSFIFLKLLGLVCLGAFVSLWVQVDGLIGSHGLLPLAELMKSSDSFSGLEKYFNLPTLFWFSSSDIFIHLVCGAGVVFCLLLIVGLCPGFSLTAIWFLYLSLVTVCRNFTQFQWDNLLLEAVFLASVLAPWKFNSIKLSCYQPPRLGIWLPRLLYLKLMFFSGLIKILSGDPLWRQLTALTVHYQTQPLPTLAGWWFFQMPVWFHRLSCVMMFVVELLSGWLMFAGRRGRQAAFIAGVFLQLLIILTGNYGFFNYLALCLAFTLLDDDFFKLKKESENSPPFSRRVELVIVLLLFFSGSFVKCYGQVTPSSPSWMATYQSFTSPLRTINTYGLFAVMTPSRREVIVEGSDDGTNWHEYYFKYKPTELDRVGHLLPFHMPRLDWQFWFLALGDSRQNFWSVRFYEGLLKGTPEILALIDDRSVFYAKPPQYVRALLYEYKMTTASEQQLTGYYWTRTLLGGVTKPMRLQGLDPR